MTRAEAAQIDMKLIENPAIMALDPYDGEQERRAVLSWSISPHARLDRFAVNSPILEMC